MAFLVETGTGSSSANSLVTVGVADTYHVDRGNTVWAGLGTSAKQALLIKATDYLCNAAVFPWKGTTQFATQALPWPRKGVTATYGLAVPESTIPLAVQQATADLALIANTTTLQPVVPPAPSGVKRKKVDVLETEYFSGAESGSSGNPATQTAGVTSAMGLLQPLLRLQGTLTLSAGAPVVKLPVRAETEQAERPLFYVEQLTNKG